VRLAAYCSKLAGTEITAANSATENNLDYQRDIPAVSLSLDRTKD
jgi:hypothetical protein